MDSTRGWWCARWTVRPAACAAPGWRGDASTCGPKTTSSTRQKQLVFIFVAWGPRGLGDSPAAARGRASSSPTVIADRPAQPNEWRRGGIFNPPPGITRGRHQRTSTVASRRSFYLRLCHSPLFSVLLSQRPLLNPFHARLSRPFGAGFQGDRAGTTLGCAGSGAGGARGEERRERARLQ